MSQVKLVSSAANRSVQVPIPLTYTMNWQLFRVPVLSEDYIVEFIATQGRLESEIFIDNVEFLPEPCDQGGKFVI